MPTGFPACWTAFPKHLLTARQTLRGPRRGPRLQQPMRSPGDSFIHSLILCSLMSQTGVLNVSSVAGSVQGGGCRYAGKPPPHTQPIIAASSHLCPPGPHKSLCSTPTPAPPTPPPCSQWASQSGPGHPVKAPCGAVATAPAPDPQALRSPQGWAARDPQSELGLGV